MLQKIIYIILFVVFVIIYERFFINPIRKLLAKVFKKHKFKYKTNYIFHFANIIARFLLDLPRKILRHPPKS